MVHNLMLMRPLIPDDLAVGQILCKRLDNTVTVQGVLKRNEDHISSKISREKFIFVLHAHCELLWHRRWWTVKSEMTIIDTSRH